MVIMMTDDIPAKTLHDLEDMANMLRNVSAAKEIDAWITRWRNENAETHGNKEEWHDCFPSVGDITISSDIVDGMLQIWVEKHFFINGKVIKIAQQAF